jgi:UDP-N-acetylmuramoyl-tripeptide--D-alanyl-D-alanine ligase
VIPLPLEDVRRIPGRLDVAPWADDVTGVQVDSRRIEENDLFVAVGDGAAFVKHAFARGAAATLVADDAFAALAALAIAVRARSDARVIGITGSTGKTSTKDILAALCAPHARTVAAEEGYNNEIGLPLTVLRLEPATEVLVVEMGMRGLGQIRELAEIARPDVGVITAIGPVHLELLGTVERVAEAKAELLAALPPGAVGVVPADALLASHLPTCLDLRTFGPGGESVVTGFEAGDGTAHVSFDLHGRPLEVDFTFTARHQAENALGALLAVEAIDLPFPDSPVEVELSRWRGEESPLPGGGLLVNDSYNANPMSMRAALAHLAERAGNRRRVAVLGDMAELGVDAPAFHVEVGSAVGESGVDLLVAVGPLARGYVQAAPEVDSVWFETVSEAAGTLPTLIRPGDAVLVKASRAMGLEKLADALSTAAA